MAWGLCFLGFFKKKIMNFTLLKCKQYCSFEFLSFHESCTGSFFVCKMFHGDLKSSVKSIRMNTMTMC